MATKKKTSHPVRNKSKHFAAVKVVVRKSAQQKAGPHYIELGAINVSHFITEVKKAGNYQDLNTIIGDEGLKAKSIEPLIEWLELSDTDLAGVIDVSPRTISRWRPSTRIGVHPSKALVRIDEVLSRGREIFGDDESFKLWLDQPNTALNDQKPIELLRKPFGVEMIEDALEALQYGNLL
jgi:putative toxin-antitoxin system antitoxin component (TIGR02293 family)